MTRVLLEVLPQHLLSLPVSLELRDCCRGHIASRAPALCSVGTAGPTVVPADTLRHLRTPRHTATLLRPQEPAPSLRKYCPTGNEHISWTESQQVRQETNREEGPTSHRQHPGRGGRRRHSSQVRHVPPTLQPHPPPSSLAVGGGPCLVAWGEGELAAPVAGFPREQHARRGRGFSPRVRKGSCGSLTPLALRAAGAPWLPPPAAHCPCPG